LKAIYLVLVIEITIRLTSTLSVVIEIGYVHLSTPKLSKDGTHGGDDGGHKDTNVSDYCDLGFIYIFHRTSCKK